MAHEGTSGFGPDTKPQTPTALRSSTKDWAKRNAAAAAKAAGETERRRLAEIEWHKKLKADRKERASVEKKWIRTQKLRGR